MNTKALVGLRDGRVVYLSEEVASSEAMAMIMEGCDSIITMDIDSCPEFKSNVTIKLVVDGQQASSNHDDLIVSLRNTSALSVDCVQIRKAAAATIVQLETKIAELSERNEYLAETCLNYEGSVIKLEDEIQRLKNCLVSNNPANLG